MKYQQPVGLKQDHTGRMYIPQMNGLPDVECGREWQLKTMETVDLIGHVWSWTRDGYVARPCHNEQCKACVH